MSSENPHQDAGSEGRGFYAHFRQILKTLFPRAKLREHFPKRSMTEKDIEAHVLKAPIAWRGRFELVLGLARKNWLSSEKAP